MLAFAVKVSTVIIANVYYPLNAYNDLQGGCDPLLHRCGNSLRQTSSQWQGHDSHPGLLDPRPCVLTITLSCHPQGGRFMVRPKGFSVSPLQASWPPAALAVPIRLRTPYKLLSSWCEGASVGWEGQDCAEASYIHEGVIIPLGGKVLACSCKLTHHLPSYSFTR